MTDFKIPKLLEDYEFKKSQNEHLKKYSFNILDELHADENAHTRILVKLLRYPGENKDYPILNDFISLLNEKLRRNGFELSNSITGINESDIQNQINNIDCCILNKIEHEAIIVENKIENAVDQDKQLEQYFDTIKQEPGIDESKIFIVYLTADGNKKVSDNSLTDKLKQKLDYKDSFNTGRYIELNYSNDILQMLKVIKDEKIFQNDIVAAAGLEQYVDYLIGRFEIRDWEKEYYEKMRKDLLKMLHIPQNESIISQYDKLEEIKHVLNSFFENLASLQSNLPNETVKKYQSLFAHKFGPFSDLTIYEYRTLTFDKWIYDRSIDKPIETKNYFVLDINFNVKSVECKFFYRKSQSILTFEEEYFEKELVNVLEECGFSRSEKDFAYRYFFYETTEIYNLKSDNSPLTEFLNKLLEKLLKLNKKA